MSDEKPKAPEPCQTDHRWGWACDFCRGWWLCVLCGATKGKPEGAEPAASVSAGDWS